VDDLDNLLARSQRVDHLLSQSTLADNCKKILHDAKVDVSFEKSQLQVTQRVDEARLVDAYHTTHHA
jgi:hypothetical protein